MTKVISLLFAAMLLVSCGSSMQDRMISGALIGAATGGIGTAVFAGEHVAAGALIGAGVGAVGGAVIDDDLINLGEPVWK